MSPREVTLDDFVRRFVAFCIRRNVPVDDIVMRVLNEYVKQSNETTERLKTATAQVEHLIELLRKS